MSSPPGTNLQGSRMQHLDEMTILLYLERQLDRARAAEVSSHTQECDACRTLMRALERESRLLTRAMLEEEEPLPSRLASFQETARRSMQWIWMVMFGLATTGVYAIYTSYIEPVQNRLQDAGFGGTNLLGLLIFQGAFWKGWQSMASFVEIVALLVVGGSAALLFRRWFRRGTLAALLMAGMCAAAMMPGTASATEFRKGSTAEVAQGESIKGDVFLNGDRMRVEGTVSGDVFAFGRTLEVGGNVGGDVIVFAHTVHITGKVAGNVRAFNNNLTITGDVGRSLTAICESLAIEKSGKVGASVNDFSDSFTLDGHVMQDVLAMNGRLDLSGQVDGGIRLKAESLSIQDAAQVGGPIHYEGTKPPEVSPKAKLASAVDYVHAEKKPEHSHGGYYLWRLLWTSAFVLYGLVLIHLMPSFSKDCVLAAERIGASLGLGLLVGISLFIAAIIACVTFVGAPLGLLGFALWMVMLFSAQIVFGGLLGRWILGPSKDTWGQVGRMALGMAIVGVAVPIIHQVHILEAFVKLAVVIWGFGAISLALYRRLPGVATPSIPIPPPAI